MNSKSKSNIFKKLKKRDINRFSIFMAIAFVFLLISKLSNDYKQRIKLQINLTNLEEEIIVKQDSSNVIDILVEAKGFALVPYIFSDYKDIDIDSKEDIINRETYFIFDVRKHRYLIEEQLGSSYKLLTISPDTLFLPYSKRASKYIPVVLNSEIEYATGFDIKGDFTFDVDSVKIVGAEDKILGIKSIQTQPLKLSKVSSLIDEEIDLIELEDIEIFPKEVRVKADVQRFTEGTIEVPITITGKPEDLNLNYFPKTVTISYYVDLESYSSISVNDFEVHCHYDKDNEGQTYFEPKIIKSPNFIKRLSIKQKRVDFIKL